jgi:hypothetical protein
MYKDSFEKPTRVENGIQEFVNPQKPIHLLVGTGGIDLGTLILLTWVNSCLSIHYKIYGVNFTKITTFKFELE